ncbi:hypothetical protein MRX96_034194 [Rhipicephalus microplus]
MFALPFTVLPETAGEGEVTGNGDCRTFPSGFPLPQFRGASAISKFVRVFNHLFDLFNSRNPFARSYKAPLRKQNEACWKPFFAYTQAYIKGLRDPAGQPVLEGLKKTGFVGFLICMASTEKTLDEIVGQGVPLRFENLTSGEFVSTKDYIHRGERQQHIAPMSAKVRWWPWALRQPFTSESCSLEKKDVIADGCIQG